jgi:hypothetical protein
MQMQMTIHEHIDSRDATANVVQEILSGSNSKRIYTMQCQTQRTTICIFDIADSLAVSTVAARLRPVADVSVTVPAMSEIDLQYAGYTKIAMPIQAVITEKFNDEILMPLLACA